MASSPPEESVQINSDAGNAAEDESRRDNVRAKLNLRVDFGTAFDIHTTAYMHNIGHGGVYIKTENPLEVGAMVELEFTLPDGFRTIRAQARVAWNRRDDGSDNPFPAGMGLAFIDIVPADKQALDGYVEQLAQQKR